MLPGLIAGLMLMVGIYIAARINNLPAQTWAGWGEIFESGRDAFWGLLLIVIILGGIYGGIFTPTEAAAVASVYAFFVANFIYKDMGPLAVHNNEKGHLLWRIVTVLWHKDTREALFQAGKLTYNADVYYCQCINTQACAHRGTYSTGHYRSNAVGRVWDQSRF